jgi:hypothetical protein
LASSQNKSEVSVWKDLSMLRVNLASARPGMTLAMPIFHPTLPGHTLLRPGFTLDELTIARLTELHVGSIWIRYPALANVLKYVSPTIAFEHAAVTHLLGRLLDSARLGNGAGTAEMDFHIYAGAVRSLVGKLVAEPNAAILIGDLLCATSPLALHSGNVCFMSLLMGLKLDAYLIEERRRVSARAARGREPRARRTASRCRRRAPRTRCPSTLARGTRRRRPRVARARPSRI